MDINPTLRELFEKYPEINSVYLFGSRARKESHTLSDWDYGVLTVATPLPTDKLLEIIKDLEKYHRTSVDVVDLRGATPLLVHRIIRDRQVIYEKDPLLRVDFETRLLGEYLDWVQFLEVHHL